MSFFGFETTLPRDREAPAMSPRSFFETSDPFARLSGPSASRATHEAAGDNEEDVIDFDDTYDGLGEQLDDADDVLNDDTFGGQATAPTTQAAVGKDFDFFGQTAQVSSAIDQEHLRYNRQHPPTLLSPAGVADPSRHASRPVRTGYEKYKEPGGVSDLKVNASLWGVSAKTTASAAEDAAPPEQDYEEQETESRARPASKKMMSLEEVEAAMLAQNKKRASGQGQIAQAPASSGIPGRLQEHHIESGQLQVRPLPALEQHATTVRQPSPPEQGYPQPIVHDDRSRIRPRSWQPQPIHDGVAQTPVPVPVLQPRQILQNPNRHPVQAHHIPAMAMPDSQQPHQQRLPALQGPPIPAGPLRHPLQGPYPPQTVHLSDEDRQAFLTEEAKRAKRNHKIYLLSRGNGLMTPQDKNFITRIQLQQLVTATGNPNEQDRDTALADDFYYRVHSHIRNGPRENPHQPLNHLAQTYLFQAGGRAGGVNGRRVQRGGDSHAQRMEQQVQRAVEAAKLRPKDKQLIIQGSLGKISFSNAKTPKPLLNIKRPESAPEANRPSGFGGASSDRRSQLYVAGTSNRLTVLRQIERVHTALMKMEDHERRMPPQPIETNDESMVQAHAEWAEEMQNLNQKLWAELKVMEPIVPNSLTPHPFIAFLAYAKGKKVIPRIFRQIDQGQRVKILVMIMFHIGVLDVVRRAQLRPGERQLPAAVREEVELFSQAVLPSLFAYVNEAPLTTIIGLLGILLDSSNVHAVARSKVGLSILTMFLSRTELVKQGGDVDEEDWGQWTALYSRLFDALELTLGTIFPGAVNADEDIYVWQFLAALGLGASPEQQQRLVMAVKDRVMETVSLSKTLPADMSSQRLGNVNLFMRALGLDVELLG